MIDFDEHKNDDDEEDSLSWDNRLQMDCMASSCLANSVQTNYMTSLIWTRLHYSLASRLNKS